MSRPEYRPEEHGSHPDDLVVPGDPAGGVPGPLYSEESLCPCGARAEACGLCVKCRARAAWARRRAYRDRPDPQDDSRRRRWSTRSGADSRRPGSARPGQRRPRRHRRDR